MAQTNYTPIQLYYSSTASAVPLNTNLASGELAINITDGLLFYKDNAGTVQKIGYKLTPTTAGGTGLTSFTANGIVFASSTSALNTSSALTFDGTKLTIGAFGNTGRRFEVNGSEALLDGAGQFELIMGDGGVAYMSLTTTDNATSLKIRNYSGNSDIAVFERTTGNVGIGTSSSLTEKLNVVNSGSYAAVRVSNGTNSSFFGYANADGNYNTGAKAGDAIIRGAVGVSIEGNNGGGGMRLDSSGNLGLGVTPSAWDSRTAFQNGAASMASTSANRSVAEFSANSYLSSGGIFRYIYTANASLYQQVTGEHRFFTASSGTAGNPITFTQAMTLDSSGNLGVGVTSPGARLHISTGEVNLATFASTRTSGSFVTLNLGTSGTGLGFIGHAPQIIVGASNNQLGIRAETDLLFATGGNTERARIDSSGTLCIGTTSALSSAFKTNIENGRLGVSANSDQYALYLRYNTSTNGVYIGSPSANALAFSGSGGGEYGRFDSSGNLIVAGTASGLTNNNSQQITANGYLISNHVNGTSSGSVYVYFGYNGSSIGSITQNGTTGVLYNLTSDYRLKNDQQALTGAKDFIMALKPKKWQWWDGSGEGVGFVAHEFMEVAKHSGNGEKDAVDSDGKPVYQSIQPSSSEVMANLVAFVQELKAEIDSLKSQLNGA